MWWFVEDDFHYHFLKSFLMFKSWLFLKYLKHLNDSARFQAKINILMFEWSLGVKLWEDIGVKVCRE